VNDNLIDSWVANNNNNHINIREILDVQLKPGDEIRIVANSDRNMLTRIDYMDIEVK